MKMYNRVLSFSISACMAVGLSVGYNQAEASVIESDGGKDTYIVQMENSETLEEISEKYGNQAADDSESYENLENENCIVLDLTKSQAASLSNTEGIDFLESDLEMQGAADELTPVSECDTEWNINMVKADLKENTEDVKDCDNPVKVAVIDSGIDYTNGINVVKRKNFIPDEDDISILYEDMSGHGTSVAGVIAASGEENKDLTGIARNAEIYSAKVLNQCNRAPISRVVEGIYWAIEQGVDIINLSLGTSKPSELLEKAVKDAYDNGILLVASAGNNEKAGVEYPAAYDEVIAVASVNSQGEHSTQSAVGGEVEIAAPGEKVNTASCFDGEIVVSGTSIATPHITAIAARLWEKDRTKSARFIRGLIDASANEIGDKSKYGFGIADLSYAMEIYDEYAKNYVENIEENVEETLEKIEDAAELTKNDANIEVYKNDYVEGRWKTDDHEEIVKDDSMKKNELMVLKWGATVPDRKIGFSNMKRHPYFHGFGYGEDVFSTNGKMVVTNYIASSILLSKMAERFYNNDRYSDPPNVPGLSATAYNRMCEYINEDKLIGKTLDEDGSSRKVSYTWEYMLKGTVEKEEVKFEVSNRNKALVLYGMALHTATDAFAHSTYINGKRIIHPGADNKNLVDKITEKKLSRYNCAVALSSAIAFHARHGLSLDLKDWLIPYGHYEHDFKLVGYSQFAKSVDAEIYNKMKLNFDDMNLNIENITEY